jgi:uncharacterized protein YijF (DUF1287 family)
MIYGKGGSGGATTSVSGGGSASMGQAARIQPMDIAAMAKLDAETKLLEKQADKVSAEIPKLEAETENISTSTAIADIQKEILSSTQSVQIDQLKDVAKQEAERLKQMSADTTVKQATVNDEILQVKADLSATIISNELKSVQIDLTKEQIHKLQEDIKVNWARYWNEWTDTDTRADLKEHTKWYWAENINLREEDLALAKKRLAWDNTLKTIQTVLGLIPTYNPTR